MSTIVSKARYQCLRYTKIFPLVLGLYCFAGLTKNLQAGPIVKAKPATTINVSQLFSRGDYGLDVESTMHATVLQAAYRTPTWGTSISVPYLNITGPAIEVYEDIDTGELFLVDIDDDNRQGLGDTVISFDQVAWQKPREGKKLRLGASLKLPTGDEYRRLGNGKTNLSLFAKGRMRKRSTVYSAQLGYQFMGKTEFTDYNNRVFLSTGFFHHLDRHWGVGAGWRFKQASLEEREHQQSLSTFVSRKLNRSWNAAIRVNLGLTDAVADFSGGLQLSYRRR